MKVRAEQDATATREAIVRTALRSNGICPKWNHYFNDKHRKLDGKIRASESNFSGQITRHFDCLRNDVFVCVCVFLSKRVGDIEDAIDELNNEVEKLKKNERKRTGVEK